MWLNPVVSSAAATSGTNATYHTLSGRAKQLLLCSNSSDNYFYYNCDTTGLNTSASQRLPGDTPVLINVNYPSYITILGGDSGYVYITEFV